MNIPAFPVEMIYTQENEKFNGMSLRDYFAAKAMQGMIQSPKPQHTVMSQYANTAYAMADAMLKAREA
jgi:hypothetical protein